MGSLRPPGIEGSSGLRQFQIGPARGESSGYPARLVTPIEDVLTRALTMWGREYEFGFEIGPSRKRPQEADCSELVEWACGRAGVTPIVPDGAYFQWVHCGNHETRIPVQQGIDTRGALLFMGDGIGFGRDAIHHVAFSLGDGTTIEARGEAWGIGVFSAVGRDWTFAGRIPGVEYGPPSPFPRIERTLEHGMEGEDVKWAQFLLGNARRRWIEPDAPDRGCDGVFGDLTRDATIGFQEDCNKLGLDPPFQASGRIGPYTLQVCGYLIANGATAKPVLPSVRVGGPPRRRP